MNKVIPQYLIFGLTDSYGKSNFYERDSSLTRDLPYHNALDVFHIFFSVCHAISQVFA